MIRPLGHLGLGPWGATAPVPTQRRPSDHSLATCRGQPVGVAGRPAWPLPATSSGYANGVFYAAPGSLFVFKGSYRAVLINCPCAPERLRISTTSNVEVRQLCDG